MWFFGYYKDLVQKCEKAKIPRIAKQTNKKTPQICNNIKEHTKYIMNTEKYFE